MTIIRGAGGGGKGGGNRTPVEADDSLQSIQMANVVDLVSEGEIQGLDDGYKSIFWTAHQFKVLMVIIILKDIK